jgi:hypothetical protein
MLALLYKGAKLALVGHSAAINVSRAGSDKVLGAKNVTIRCRDALSATEQTSVNRAIARPFSSYKKTCQGASATHLKV